MSALPSFSRLHGKKFAVLGLVLAGSLGLAGCSGGTPEVKDSPSSSASNIPAPPPADSGVSAKISKNTEGVFSNEGAFSVPFSVKDANQLATPDGGVSRFKDSSGKDTVSFTPYTKDGAKTWNLTLPEIKGSNVNPTAEESLTPIELLRWEGKSYVVIEQVANVTTSASGLQAGTAVTVNNTYVVDLETGKLVNTVKAETPGDKSEATAVFTPYSYKTVASKKPVPFLNVLITKGSGKNSSIVRALNPLTGSVIVEAPGSSNEPVYFAGSKFRHNEISSLINTFEGYKSTKLVDTFGDFALVKSGNEIEIGVYDKKANTHYSLLNLATGAKVASMECGLVTNEYDGRVVYSADFRYVSFSGSYVFDTQTGKSFCGTKTASRSGFSVIALDNNGNMFGVNDAGKLLKVALTDESVVELYDVASHDVPSSITSHGDGVFPSGDKTDILPLKK